LPPSQDGRQKLELSLTLCSTRYVQRSSSLMVLLSESPGMRLNN
jgi:hypothetical protein